MSQTSLLDPDYCPYCGQKIRRRIGEGTAVNPCKPPTENEMIVLDVLRALGEASVRQILRYLHDNGIERHGNRAWNYHLVQADLSRLVGRGLVEMHRRGKTFFYRVVKNA